MTTASEDKAVDWGHYRWLLVICAVAVGLQCLFWTGVTASDDFGYLAVAREFDGRLPDDPGKHIMFARIGFWFPLRVCLWVLGDTWWALLPVPFLATLGTLACVWSLARRCFNSRVALVAVGALGLTPYMLISATVALPDGVCGLFMIAALAVGAPALLEKQLPAWWLPCAIAGLFIGMGYSAKEYAVLMLPGIGAYVLFCRPRCRWVWERFAVVCLGALFWLGLEMMAFWRLTGDPMFHYNVIASSQRAWGMPIPDTSLRSLYWYWTGIIRWLMDPGSHFGWWGPVYFAGMSLAVFRRTAASSLVLCCLLVQGVYQSIGSVDLFSYWPMWHQPRYLVPLFPLGAVLIGHVACWLWDGPFVKWALDGLRAGSAWSGRIRSVGRLGLVAAAVFLVGQSVVLANQECRRWGASSIFFTTRQLLEQPNPPWPDRARMRCSGQTGMRILPLVKEAGFDLEEYIYPPPQTAWEWQDRYGDCYVWVSFADRRPLFKGYQGLLDDTSREALQEFPLVATASPPTDRLNQVLAWLDMAAPRFDAEDRVEVFYIPPNGPVAKDGQLTGRSTPSRVLIGRRG